LTIVTPRRENLPDPHLRRAPHTLMKYPAAPRTSAAWTLGILLATMLAVLAATYTYKCPKCGLIQTYGQPNPGVKCPNDGWTMVAQ